MATPHTFENTLRIHDAAFFNWLGGLRVDYGTVGTEDRSDFPILRVFASPDRAFAAVVDLLVRMCWIDGATAQAMRDNADNFAVLPLPIATIYRGDAVPDPELRGTPKEFRKRWYNLTTRQWERHPWPGHYRTPYTVSFWMTRRYTEAFIREWVLGQLGARGLNENETLIPVVHDEPWGLIRQALRFDDMADQSELEGEEPRWIRFDATFNLRTWLFKVVRPGADEVQRIGLDTRTEATSERVLAGDEEGDEALGASPEAVWSENLYIVPIPNVFLATVMVKTGDATVEPGILAPRGKPRRDDLHIQVEVQADAVTVGEWPIVPDADGVAVYSYTFEYLASDPVELETLQRDPIADTIASADSFVLPRARRWERFHLFTLVRGEGGPAAVEDRRTLILRVAGIPPAAVQDVHLHALDIRHVVSQTKMAPTTTVSGGGFVTRTWTGLAKQGYLVILVLTAPSGGLHVATFTNDAAVPTTTVQRSLDASVNAGAAVLMQPDRDSLVLKVPTGMTVEAAYIQGFDGPFNGHTVGFDT